MKTFPLFIVACVAITTFATLAEPPTAKEHDELKFHAPPKPMLPGTVTQDWPCLLGPTHDMVSAETNLLGKFGPEGPPLVWEVKRGLGYAAPAIAAGRLVMLHRMDDNEVVDCLEPETGKRFWRFAYPTQYRDRYGINDGPRCAPVIDGGFTYIYGVEGTLRCLDLSTGNVKWSRNLSADYNLPQDFFGVGATPLIEGDVIVVNVGAPKGPCVVGLKKLTGETLWATDEKLSNTWGPSYASPVPATVNGQRRVFVFAGGESRPPTGGLMSVDPLTGKVDFAVKHRSRTYESVNASSPLVLGKQVFVSECYGSGGSLYDINADGSAKELWNSKALGTHFMQAIAKDGYLYGADGHGPLNCPLVCINQKTGEEVWRKEAEWQDVINTPNGPRKRNTGLGLCSMLSVADGRVLVLGDTGHLLWMELSPQGYKELSRASLFFATETWTGPVLSHGLLYICQNTRDGLHGVGQRLLCYDLRIER